MTRQEQAYQAGQWARQEGRTEAAMPLYGPTEECMVLRKKWREGWRAEDAQRSKKSAK